jgi:hypothetical protein
MKRTLFLGLILGLSLASAASAQSFGTGPVTNQKTGDVRMQGGGFSPYNMRGTQYESVINPQTGRFERRSVTTSPLNNRVIERQQNYDPQTGSYTSTAVQRDSFTGQTLMTRRVKNPFTGESTQEVGMINPVTGQGYGFTRRQQVDPYTGTIRRDVQQYNGAPNGFYSNSTLYNPYTGQFIMGYPNSGFRPLP